MGDDGNDDRASVVENVARAELSTTVPVVCVRVWAGNSVDFDVEGAVSAVAGIPAVVVAEF